MLKIAFVTNVFKNQIVGSARFANLIYEYYLNDRNIELHIVKTDDAEGQNFHNMDIQATFFQNQKGIIHVAQELGKELTQLHEKIQFDKIIFNDVSLGYSFLKKGKPKAEIISILHDEENVHATNGFSIRSIINRWIKGQKAKAARWSDKVLVNSDFLKSVVLDQFHIEESKLHVIHVGIDIDKNAYAKHRLSFNEKIKVLFVKNNYVQGGLFDLIEALNKLNHLTFELIIVGPESDIEVLFYGKAHSHVKLKFLGSSSQEDVLNLMYTSHLFCVPSRSEALGIAKMQAMACGLPVIATKVSGIMELSDQDQYAWLAEPMNPKSLKDVIQNCISNEDLRLEKTLSARKHVEKHFNHDKMLETFHQILMQ